MRYFVLSDIHGSAYYANLAIEAYRKSGCERILLLGDVLYHGPRNPLPRDYAPKEVIALLNPLKEEILAVRGNCEAEVDQMVLDFPVMADYAILEWGKHRVFLSHGHVYNEDSFPLQKDGDIFLQGHTHVPVAMQKTRGEKYFYHLNPGSISHPKEDSPHSYGILEDNSFTLYDVEKGEAYKKIEF